MNAVLSDLLQLPERERLELSLELWESVNQSDPQLTPQQEAELDRRIELHNTHPEEGVDWQTVRKNALEKLNEIHTLQQ